MKSIGTDPPVHAAEGDERIRTAVPGGTNESDYGCMDEADLAMLVIEQLRDDEPHGEHDDSCPFCRAVCALNELAARAAVARAGKEEA